MHKRPKMHDMLVNGPQGCLPRAQSALWRCTICIHGVFPRAQSAFTGFSHVHNLHHGDAQSAFTGFSHVHNRHYGDAQSALNTCSTCIRTTSVDPSCTARRADHLAFTHGHRKTNSPARDNPEMTGGRLAAAPSHIQSGLAARLPTKSASDQRRADILTVQPSHDMRRLPERAASISLGGICAQNGSSSPLQSDPQLYSLSKVDLFGIWLCAYRLPDMRSQNVTVAYGTRRRSEASSHTV